MEYSLKGDSMGKILIYGGSGGIGSAVARKMVDRGDEVHLVGRNEESLAALAGELGCTYTVGDVRDTAVFAEATAAAGDALGGLVYSIGTINLGSVQRLSREDYIDDFTVNSMGAALAIQAAVKPMKKAGKGSVVLFSSVATLQGFSMHASIGMAKGAINGLTLSLAAELAPHIRVNAVAPSLTETTLAEPMLKNEQIKEKISSMHALKRLGTAEDIADCVLYLMSENAGWVTGQIFSVDGGRSTLRING